MVIMPGGVGVDGEEQGKPGERKWRKRWELNPLSPLTLISPSTERGIQASQQLSVKTSDGLQVGEGVEPPIRVHACG